MTSRENIDEAVEVLRASARDGLKPLRAMLLGPAGTGKLLVARRYYERMIGRVSPTPREEAELKAIFCHAPGVIRTEGNRPLRMPHHTISAKGMVGGVMRAEIVRPVPGELSLAHAGLLALDDLPEFQRRTVEELGSALRNGEVVLRWKGDALARFPSKPQAIIATADIDKHERALEFAKILGLTVFEEPER